MRPRRFLALLALTVPLVLLGGCSGDSGSSTSEPPSPLWGVAVVDGAVTLNGACHRTLDADVARRGDQIVLSHVSVDGPESDDDCMSVSRIEVDASAGIAPGMDVVAPDEARRFVFVRDSYVRVEYCGLDTPRCVEFSTDPVPAECSEASLRYATIGLHQGVYPLEVVRCEGDWAVIQLDLCAGQAGEQGTHCGAEDGWELMTKVEGAPYWQGTGFEQDLFCPEPARKYGSPGLPDWVCEV